MEINSRDINDLTPEMAKLCKEFVARCKAAGIDVIITSTFRDNSSQAALYAQGRTTAGKKVTNAPAGSSYHNYRIAFDFCPIVNGKAQWNDINLFKKCGAIAKALGLEYGGDWTSFKDYPHVQERGHTIAELKKQFPNGR
jgi:peptidoglycan L-alanyl-D-glutamate endopeptidase CwlK